MTLGFKLRRLYLEGNPVFSKIDVKFFDQDDKPLEPYTSLIIGPNGTGKSNLLRCVINLFAELNSYKTSVRRVGRVIGKFFIEYSIDYDSYFYHNLEKDELGFQFSKFFEGKPQVWKNNTQIDAQDVDIPETIIAVSIMLTDKFPVEINDFDNYVYLGVKANPNTARTTSFIRKTIDLLYNALEDEFVLGNLKKGLDFLEYDHKLFVSYSPRYKNIIFKDDITEKEFVRFFTHYWEFTNRSKDSPPWSLNAFNRIKENSPSKIAKLVRLCKKIKRNLEYEYEGSRAQYFEFDIFDNLYSREELSLIRDLHSLDLISYPALVFQKGKRHFDIVDSSSGEYHFISTYIGLLATIKPNSLILIDEPENSLHPNWQMKYISFLKRVFKSFTSSHIIVATHSHLMISDLAKNSSSLIALRKDKQITSEPIPANTYGWSAEEILLNVFHTPSTRNFYLSEKLGEIFKLISEEPDERNVPEVKKQVNELKKLDLSGLSKEDPLKGVLAELFKKFENA
jgi:predicted ATP-dependent endonuclease of OLD family